MKNDIIQAQTYLSSTPTQPDKAIHLLMKYKNVNAPGSWVVSYMLGFAYVQKSEFKTAVKYLESARKKAGNNLDILQILSETYIKLQEFAKAEPILNKILNQQEHNAQAWKNLGLVYAARDEYEEALRVLVKANNFKPEDLSIATTAGKVYAQCGKLDEAWKAFSAVLSIDDQMVEAHLGKARVKVLHENLNEAMEFIQKAESVRSGWSIIMRFKAEVLLQMGALQPAADLLDELLTLNPNDFEARVLYATYLKACNDLDKAESEYLKALHQGADSESTVPNYAETVIQNPSYDAATTSKIIKKVVKRFPLKSLSTDVPEWNVETENPLRVGFISDRFWENPVGHELLDLVQYLPKDKYEVHLYSTSRKNDSVTRSFTKHCEQFNFVFKVSPIEIRETILSHNVDVLIDCSAEYVPLINKVVQRKPAPILLKWAKYATNPFEYEKLDYLIFEGKMESTIEVKKGPLQILLPEYESTSGEARAVHFSKALDLLREQRSQNQHTVAGVKRAFSDVRIDLASEEEIEQLIRKNKTQEPVEETTNNLIPDSFWNGMITTQRARKTVDTTHAFFTEDFSPDLLHQIVEETEERLKEFPTDNRAFFVQARALQALPPNYKFKKKDFPELDAHLQKKEWWFKRAIYSYWFDKVEWKRLENGTQVSAIVIANTFKERSVQNLKKLADQLEGIGEIIFVNNGAKDSDFDPLMPYISTYVRAMGNSGAYLARNLGAIFAKGTYLLFVDDDGIPDNHFIQAHLEAHAKREVIVSRGVYYSSNVVDDPLHYNIGTKMKPAYTILEGNAMYNAAAFYKTGGWGDYILFGHGGKDLSYRLLEQYPNKEQQIYVPASRLHHEYFRGASHKSEKVEKQAVSLKLLEALHPGLTDVIDSWPTEFSTNKDSSTFIESPALLVLPETKKSKFIHLCRNHVYAQSLSDMIEFLNQSSDQQHWLLVEQSPWNVGGEGYSIEENKNPSTLFFNSGIKSDVDGIIRELIHSEVTAVFFHGLFRPWESHLLNAVGAQKHVGWIIWGGDLYKPIQRNQHRVFPHQRISSIHTVIEGDVKLFNTYYGEKPSYSFTYPYPALYGDIAPSHITSTKKILVGNSGDASNNHIQILHELAQKSDISEYELILPVAYNFGASYKEEVETTILELGLSNQVRFHDSFIAPEEYRALISEVDVLIMAHDRQQAMGNTLMGLYFNKPVFLKQNIQLNGSAMPNPGWEFLDKNGLEALPFESLESYDSIAEILKKVDPSSNTNKVIIEKEFGLKARAQLLQRNCEHLFETIHGTKIAEEKPSNLVAVDF